MAYYGPPLPLAPHLVELVRDIDGLPAGTRGTLREPALVTALFVAENDMRVVVVEAKDVRAVAT